MKSVWLIEDGEYSDYRIVGVFSSKENADLMCALCGGIVNKWPLDPAIEQLNAGLWPYDIRMAMDGTTELVARRASLPVDYMTIQLRVWVRTKSPAHKDDPGVQDAINGTVWAESEIHAAKIVNERRIAFLETGVLPG